MYLAEQRHVVLSVLPSWNAGITPICWKTSRRLSSSRYSTNSRSSVRQISMERISIRFPVAAASPRGDHRACRGRSDPSRDFSTTQAPDVNVLAGGRSGAKRPTQLSQISESPYRGTEASVDFNWLIASIARRCSRVFGSRTQTSF